MNHDIEGVCPICNEKTFAETCHNGIGYVQISPQHCDNCGWVEGGCPADMCLPDRCYSWDVCKGKSIQQNVIPGLDIGEAF